MEHFAALRTIPDLLVIRPADANETAYAWKYILENRDRPVALLLSRQGMPILDQNRYASAANVSRGAYVLTSSGNPEVILLASGSEVCIAMEAAAKLEAQGVASQVVSMPCWALFEKQDEKYRNSVIPPSVKARVGVEAATDFGWHRWLGDHGGVRGAVPVRCLGPVQSVLRRVRHHDRYGRQSGQRSPPRISRIRSHKESSGGRAADPCSNRLSRIEHLAYWPRRRREVTSAGCGRLFGNRGCARQ